jgi:hypothetical protein
LDFLPFMFLLLLPNLGGKPGKLDKALIITGVVFNCVYLASLWNIYPHFFMEYRQGRVIGEAKELWGRAFDRF